MTAPRKIEWSVNEATRLREFNRLMADLPSCPACGAPADSYYIRSAYEMHMPFPDEFDNWTYQCSAKCWKDDPDRYLAAVGGSSERTETP